jgi:hypothetical protein
VRPIDEFLELLSEAPETQIAEDITDKLSNLVGLPYEQIATEMQTILDQCAFASLASDFAMMAMDQALKMAKEQCS